MTPTGTPTDLPDLFPGFETRFVVHDGLSFHCRIAGSGPALLCLHGYPQTHACWHRLAPQLTDDATVVVMDLRGYGLSDALPPDGDDHATYSKRTMARDCVAVMQALGFDRFTVMGHDRGARVAYRLALDTPEAVDRVILLDIISTLDNWERMRWSSALKAYHWPFLAQPHPLPETLIAADPVYYLEHTLASWTKDGTLFAIDARTGHVDWTVAAPDGGPSPAIVHEDKVIFNTESCTIFAVDIETGRTVWSRWLGDPMLGQPAAAGKNGSRNLRNPYVPIFSSTAARITEPAVGASVCASGNQVCTGNIGTLMAKLKANAANSQVCRWAGISSWAKWAMLKPFSKGTPAWTEK